MVFHVKHQVRLLAVPQESDNEAHDRLEFD